MERLPALLDEFRTTNIGLSVILAIHSSSSVIAEQWVQLQLALRETIARLTSRRQGPTSLSVVQFGAKVQVIQEFTSSVAETTLKVLEMKQSCGGSDVNLKAAFKEMRTLFKLQNLPHRKLVILFTGGLNDPSSTTAAQLLKDDAINMICLGIGKDVNQVEVSALANDIHHAFFPQSLSYLRVYLVPKQDVEEPQLRALRVREEKASFFFEFKRTRVRMAELFVHSSGLWTSADKKENLTDADITTSFECSSNLEQASKYDFKAYITLESGERISSNVVSIQTRKYNPQSSILHNEASLKEENEKLKAGIIGFSQSLEHSVRIGLVGKIGNGKSAAANSFHMIFKGQFEYVSIVGSMGEKSLTGEPREVPLATTQLSILDFFGWNNPELYERDLKYLIQGFAPSNFKEGDGTRRKRNRLLLQSSYTDCSLIADFKPEVINAKQRKFYGVFIVVSPAEVAQSQHLAYVQGLYDFVNRQGLQPIILLTKVDQIDPELAEHPENIYSSELVDDYIHQLTQRRFPRGLIFPIISYFEPPVEGKANPIKDFLLLQALSSLVFNTMRPKVSTITRSIPAETQSKPKAEQKKAEVPAVQKELPAASHAEPLRRVLIRHVDTPDGAFRRCRLYKIEYEHLKQTIKEVFNTSELEKVYEVHNGNRILIECDEDTADLQDGATLEFA